MSLTTKYQPCSIFRDDIATEAVGELKRLRTALSTNPLCANEYGIDSADAEIFSTLSDQHVEAFEDGLFAPWQLRGGARWLAERAAADPADISPELFAQNLDALYLRHMAVRAAPEHARFVFGLDSEVAQALDRLTPADLRRVACSNEPVLIPHPQLTSVVLRTLRKSAAQRYRPLLICALSPLARVHSVCETLNNARCGEEFFRELTGLGTSAAPHVVAMNGKLLDFIGDVMQVTIFTKTIASFFGHTHADVITEILLKFRRAHDIDGRGNILRDGAVAVQSSVQRMQASCAIGITLALLEAGSPLPVALLTAWKYTAQTFGLSPRGGMSSRKSTHQAYCRSHLTFARLVAVVEAIKEGNVVVQKCSGCGIPTIIPVDRPAVECPVCGEAATLASRIRNSDRRS